MGIRKSYQRLTDDERNRFIEAVKHVKQTGVVDNFARIHASHFSMGIHRSSHFLPWHREFIRRFEAALQQHDPSVSIPYWDSTVHNSPSDPLWKPDFLGQFDQAWQLNRALGSDTLPTRSQVEANQQRGDYDAFWRELELDIHNPPHRWVGGVMAGIASPGDPVFFLHHAWIDMLWVQWQRQHPDAPFVSSGPGLGVNDPMMEWPDRTPADVLDHHVLGYAYDIEESGWRPWFQIHPETVFDRSSQAVTAIARKPDQIDLFTIGFDNAVWSTYWNPQTGWSNWFQIHPETVFDHSSQAVTAIARKPDQIDLFTIGFDDAVWSTYWNP